MADMIPNRESGKLEPVAVTPDFKGIAQNLKSKGMSYDDIKNKGTAVLADANSVNFDDPEGARPSDKEFVMPPDKEGRVNPALQKLLQAFEELELEESEGGATQGSEITSPQRTPELMQALEGNRAKPKQAPLEMFNMSEELDLDMAFGATYKPPVEFNVEGATEMAVLTAGFLGQAVDSLRDEYREGVTTGITFAKEALAKSQMGAAISRIEKEIDLAGTPEEVAEILTASKDTIRQPVSMLDFRRNFVVESMRPPSNRVPSIVQDITDDAIMAEELSKAQEKLWENASWSDIGWDFVELLSPTGLISEELGKFNTGLEGELVKLRTVPKEKQRVAFETLMETWIETETFLINNNNSLLISDQLQGMEEAIREGALGLIEAGGTSAEFQDKFESALNATVFAFEAKSLIKGTGGVFKFLASRVFPSNRTSTSLLPSERIPFTPFTDASNTITVNNPTGAQIVPVLKSVREELKVTASKKQPTLVRKTLEKEKKELGALKQTLNLEVTNKAARELANKEKIKFKDAVKKVNTERQEQLNAIARREETVQVMIDDFDKAATEESKLSRLNTFERDGRLAPDDLFQATGQHKVEMVYNTRDGTNAYDQLVKERTLKFFDDLDSKTLEEIASEVGMTASAMAARVTPTPSPTTDLGYPNISSRVNELILADQKDLIAGEARGVALSKQTGGTLKLQENGVAIIPNNDDASWGDFKFLFGNGDEGFDNASEAQRAMENGLVGIDVKRVVERNGKWYVEAEQKHVFDPRLDTKDLYVGNGKLVNSSGYVFDPLRRLGEDVLKGVFALKNYNRSVAQKMQNELESIFSKDSSVLASWGLRPMSAKDTNALLKALEHTDQDGIDWIRSVDEYAEIVDMTVDASQNTWKRYQRTQKLMDDIYQIRNEKYRKYLTSQGVKDVKIGDNNYRGTPVESSDGKPVFDPVTNRLVTKEDMLFYFQESQVIIKLQQPIPDETGMLRQYVFAINSDVKELPAKVLNQRAGHIDRFYRETGWTVKVSNVKVVDDVEIPYSSTTHIVASKADADRIVRETMEETGEVATATRARENDELEGIYGDESGVQFGYAGTHTKQRGGILKGSDGMGAPISNVLESLSRTVSSVEKQLDVDILNSLRARFMKQFAPYFKEKAGTKYSGRFEDMFNTSQIPDELAEKAKQWHNYIESISKIKQGENFAKLDMNINKILKMFGVSSDSQRVSSFAQNFTVQAVIVGRPLFQIPQNFTQLAYVLMKYPVEGVQSIPSLLSVLPALKKTNPDSIRAVARSMGISDEAAMDLIDDLKNNGLSDAIGMSDDFMRMVSSSGVDASRSQIGNIGNFTKNSLMTPFRASKDAQESVLRLVNVTAYLSEYRKQVINAGRPFNAKTKADMNFNAQKITQTQNSVNQFNYQDKSSVLSPMFQFMQHVHKMYLDVIVDPAMKLTKDPILKALGKEVPKRVSPLASSHLQAGGTLIATYAMFGPQGVFGNILGNKAEDAINQIDNPIAREALQGNIINEIINSTVNALGAEGNVDYSSKIHPASFIDTFYEYHIESFFQEGTINVAGAVGYMGGVVTDAGKAVAAIATSEGLDFDDKAHNIIAEIGRTVTGLSDIEKSYMAYNLGNYVYKSTLSGNLTVTPYEAVMQAFNFTPTAIQDRWSEFSGGGKGKDSPVKGIAQIYSRLMHRELAESDSFEDMLAIGVKYSSLAQASVDPLERQEVVKELSRSVSEFGDKGYLDYIKPYMEQKKLSDVLYELKSLREDASTDKMRQTIDTQIAIIQPMIETIQEVYKK